MLISKKVKNATNPNHCRRPPPIHQGQRRFYAIQQTDGIEEILLHTGQHFDANMSDVFFSELGMAPPYYNLDIHGVGHGEMTGRMLIEIEKVLLVEKPDAVLVYGDTNSTLAGALAAAKLHIPVAHVEAGLRSFNMAMPEEVNRILTDRISRWLFTPTDVAAQHLVHEGFTTNQIIPVGDVMYDVALHHGAKVPAEGGLMHRLGLQPKNYLLVTIRRRENTEAPPAPGLVPPTTLFGIHGRASRPAVALTTWNSCPVATGWSAGTLGDAASLLSSRGANWTGAAC